MKGNRAVVVAAAVVVDVAVAVVRNVEGFVGTEADHFGRKVFRGLDFAKLVIGQQVNIAWKIEVKDDRTSMTVPSASSVKPST